MPLPLEVKRHIYQLDGIGRWSEVRTYSTGTLTQRGLRARLRNLVRITLRRYKYPPDMQEEAIRLVLEQAERLSDAWVAR